MKLSKGIEIIDLGLKLGDTLIIADLHIGIEYEYWKSGVKIPSFLEKAMPRLERIIKENGAIILTSQGVFTAKLILASGNKFFNSLTVGKECTMSPSELNFITRIF